jgi:hypothetical protein
MPMMYPWKEVVFEKLNSSSQEILRLLWNPKVTVFTNVRHWEKCVEVQTTNALLNNPVAIIFTSISS